MGPLILKTYSFIAFLPWYDFFLNYGISFIKRSIDSSTPFYCLKERHSTKSKTVQQYVDLYSGPELRLYNKYGTLLNIIYVAFTYSTIMPSVWYIALVGILNTYIFERIQIAYHYRQPPLLDGRLNDKALEIL